MKILLVAPPSGSKRLFVSPPLGLMYIASALKKASHEVDIADLYSFDLNPDYSKYDFVGITGMDFLHDSILEIAKEVKDTNKDILVGVGGSHATAMPELLLEDDNIDFVFRGEFEESIKDAFNWKTLEGVCVKGHISNAVTVKNLDGIPFPDWNEETIKKYSKSSHHGFFYEKQPVIPIITSRSCPYNCTYCAGHVVSGKIWRPHSPERVLEEIDNLVNLGMKELHIEDDNFCLSLPRAESILKRIINQNYDLAISFPNGIRIDLLNDNVLSLMRKAGVYSLTFGIESGSPKIQKMTRKGLNLDFVRKQIAKVKEHDFYTQAFFILGFPYETEDDMKATIEYAKSLKLDSAFFGTFVPLAGSEDFNNLVEVHRIDIHTLDWSRLSSTNPFASSLSEKTIEKHLHKAYRQFYFRPSIVYRNIRRLKNIKQLRLLSSRLGGLLG